MADARQDLRLPDRAADAFRKHRPRPATTSEYQQRIYAAQKADLRSRPGATRTPRFSLIRSSGVHATSAPAAVHGVPVVLADRPRCPVGELGAQRPASVRPIPAPVAGRPDLAASARPPTHLREHSEAENALGDALGELSGGPVTVARWGPLTRVGVWPRSAARRRNTAGRGCGFDGHYGAAGHRRQYYKCIPADGDPPHRFTEVLPREEYWEDACERCERDVAFHEGPHAGRKYQFVAGGIAEALVAVGAGSAYREAALVARERTSDCGLT